METVSTMGLGSLGRELELCTLVNELESHVGDATDPNFSSGGMVTVRLEEGGAAITLYRTGKFQIRGAKSKESLFQTANDFRETLSKIQLSIPDFSFRHGTSVFLENTGMGFNLEKLAIALGLERTEYEPEQFPGLIYRPEKFGLTMLVFASGKVIISGTTDESEASRAIRHLASMAKGST